VKAPIDTMLDGVQWRAREGSPDTTNGLPYATHEGVLEIFGHNLRCYRLNTGQTVFDADDVHEFFGD